jgi:hypothetical protein
MIVFGPVANAAHGGQSSPSFDLLVGFAVLALTWFGFWKKEQRTKQVLFAALGVTVICFIFIVSGVQALLH